MKAEPKLIAAGRASEVFDVGGPAVHMSEVVAAIEAAAPEAAGTITYEDVPLPFPEELPGERLFLRTAGYRSDTKTHVSGKLNSKMAQSANTQDSNQVARFG